MVQVPSTNTVRESRHVAVYGLPNTIPDDKLQSFFARFGPIQRLFRQQDNQDILFVSFMDTRSASLACKTESQYDKDTPYRITFVLPDSTSKSGMASVPSTPSSARSSSPRNPDLSPQRYVDLDGDTGAETTSPCFRSQTEAKKGPRLTVQSQQSQQRNSREYWPAPEFPVESVACVVFEIQSGSTPERDVFELVKKHSKRSGIPIDIQLETTLESGYKKVRVHYFKLDADKLRADKNLIFGKPPKFRIYFPPPVNPEQQGKHPLCAPSTSYAAPKLKGDRLLQASCSIHVPHLDHRHTVDHYRRRFESYGHILDVGMVKANDERAFAVVQFTNFDDAHNALTDANIPKPMSYTSLQSLRLILFYLPLNDTKEEIMLTIRGLSDKIVDICVDWTDQSAVISFDEPDAASGLLKKMRILGRNNFGEHKVGVDYCCDRLNHYFITKRKEHIELTRSASNRTEAHHNATSPVSTSSSRREPLQSRPSIEQQQNQDEEDQASSSGSGSSSDSNSTSDSSDSDNDHEEDDFEPGRSHEPEESQSPGNEDEHHNESNGTKEHEDSSERYSQPSTSSHQDSPIGGHDEYSQRMTLPTSYEPNSPIYIMEETKQEIKSECSPTTSMEYSPIMKSDIEMPENNLTRMLDKMQWGNYIDIASFSHRIDEIVNLNQKARTKYEKLTGRPFPKFTNEDDLRTRKNFFQESKEYFYDNPCSELDGRIREWRKLSEFVDMEEYRATDPKELLRELAQLSNRSIGRPSLDESRLSRLSFDSTHHPGELAQRSHSLCVGPMTPATPFPTTQPLLVNTSQQHGTSQPSTSGVATPRNTHPPILQSPVSRHNSISSTGRPASIQTLRHHSVMFPPDVSIPPPPIPPTHDELMAPKGTPPTRRSSETLAPLRSPPFNNQIQNLMTMPIVPPPHLVAAAGTHSVSSSAHSTPRHSISGTPIHYEPSSSKSNQQQTPKSSRQEKVQVRHDSISKPGPSNAVNALQARSQSMTVGDHKKSTPTTPVVRDAGSDLIAQIMSNQPSMGFKKLPRIEKKPSALQNVHNQQSSQVNAVSTPTTPSSSSNQSMMMKDKDKEKRKKERELEREREARKEMKRKETKEERHKRKEMERAKREEDERRERKREKQRMKEKEEKRKEKEKERRKAEKEKLKKKKHRKEEDSDESESTSNDELDLDIRKPTKEMTQEERDHQLALILSKGSIIENLKSRRRTDKRSHDSSDKLRQKNQVGGPRRVLIESSDDGEGGDNDDDEKEKSESSSGEASETEQQLLPPPPRPPSLATAEPTKEHRKKEHKEREKGELSSSSDEEEDPQVEDFQRQQKMKEERENRKRQKSLTNYSSDEHGERKNATKRVRRDDSEEIIRKNAWGMKEEQKQRKRKLTHRLSSEDESRRNAKRDFRDMPHEDVSDEEEVEDASRIRRQSTSSTTSNNTAHDTKKEKSGKTPLRVVTPATTPMLSPKLLSPKILSPKSSTSSTKRPSITEHEPLISPRPRTTSSTSTSTTTSKNEISSIPEKPLSPPVTAKSSVSSIDDLAVRDEFSANSIGSPMSTTGRPMVLTKAAMKAFNSSPPKKQSSSSGQHASPTISSSSDSSSDESSSSSLEDSSDDETLKIVEPEVILDDVDKVPSNEVNQDISTMNPTSPAPPLILSAVQPTIETASDHISENELTSIAQIPTTSPVISPPQSSDAVKEDVPPVQSTQLAEIVEQEVEKHDSEPGESSVQSVEKKEQEESIEIKHIDEPVNEPEPESEIVTAPIVDNVLSPKQIGLNSIPDEAPPPTHTIISDQETDQAVQSIFDEEEADEFPQYPDFVMTKDEKDIPEKELVPQETMNSEPSGSSNSIESVDNGHKEQLISPKSLSPVSEKLSERSDEQEDKDEDSQLVVTEKEVPIEEVVEQEVSIVTAEPSPMEEEESVKSQEPELVIVESSPERTPTPGLIPNDKAVESADQPEQSKAINNDHEHLNHQQVHAPVQPQKQLEVSVSTLNSQHQHQQVVQPSPRPAFALDSQQSSGHPISVVQQSRIEQPSPRGGSNQQPELASNDLLTLKTVNELFVQLQKNPQLMNKLGPEYTTVIQQLLLHAAHGNVQNLPPEMMQLQAQYLAQQQEQHASNMSQQKKQEAANAKRQTEENSAKRRKEELDRKMEVDRKEKKRREEERSKKAAQRAAEDERKRFEQALKYMTPEARIMYNGFAGAGFAGAGLSTLIGQQSHGLTNGIAQHHVQQLHRPSSTASTSSTSARTPLQPSTSANRNSIEPSDAEEIVFQRFFYQHFPMVWTGRLALKSTETMINLHYISGNSTFLTNVLGQQLGDENPRRESVKITQRLRLDNGQLEHVGGILRRDEYTCCLALSSVNDLENLPRNESNLKASFIDYLTKKQIAGISVLEDVEAKFKSARVHVFAPGEIVSKYLSELTPTLHDYLQSTDTRYLFIVFTNDKTETDMISTSGSLEVPALSSSC